MAILAVDHDIAGRRVEIKAAIVLPPALALANDHFRIRALDAARHAGAVVADLAANPFGIGGVRERKPQGCRCDADQEFGHRQPPLRPRGQLRLRPAVSIAERRFGSVLSAQTVGAPPASPLAEHACPANNSAKSMACVPNRDRDGGNRYCDAGMLAAAMSLGAKT